MKPRCDKINILLSYFFIFLTISAKVLHKIRIFFRKRNTKTSKFQDCNIKFDFIGFEAIKTLKAWTTDFLVNN